MTRQQAINAFCKQCIYDPVSGDGHWRQQVEKCTSLACSLYEFRPISKKTGDRPVDPALSAKMRELRAKQL